VILAQQGFDLGFGQVFTFSDIAVIGLLVVLEGVLSIDNALVLGLLARRLPKEQQPRALTYGLVGAFVFRVIAIATATALMRWNWVKLVGGLYLAYVAAKYFFFESTDESESHIAVGPGGDPILIDEKTGLPTTPDQTNDEIKARTPLHMPDMQAQVQSSKKYAGFWPTVAVIELTDIAFAVDSILAAIALVGGKSEKTWVVVAGGMLGVILMRFAAVVFIKLLERFPRFETAAYLLVFVIGGKLLVDYVFNKPGEPPRVDFHHLSSPAFWTFWTVMLLCFCLGFIRKRPAPGDGGQPGSDGHQTADSGN
jgi:predicted tellurium resistance membrane protein TerC